MDTQLCPLRFSSCEYQMIYNCNFSGVHVIWLVVLLGIKEYYRVMQNVDINTELTSEEFNFETNLQNKHLDTPK